MKVIDPYRYVDGYTYILDEVSGGSFAYSVFKLRSAYVGFAMEIRRSSDNALTDVEFDTTNVVSGSSTVSAGGDLSTWAGADTLTVRTWYDQSTGGYDLQQTTDASQPLFILSDTHSLPTVRFDSVDDFLINSTANIFSSHQEGNIFSVVRNATVDNNYVITSADNASNTAWFNVRNYSGAAQNKSVGFDNDSGPRDVVHGDTDISTGSWFYNMAGSNSSAYLLRVNGVNQTINVDAGSNSGVWFGDISNRDNLVMGSLQKLGKEYTGERISEAFYFNPGITSGEITTVETDMALRYGL